MSRYTLTCDACGRTHRVQALSAAMIGTPCDGCNANLLPAEDYDAWVRRVEPMLILALRMGLAHPSDQPDLTLSVAAGRVRAEWAE